MQTSEGLKIQKILDVKIIENNEPAIEIKETEKIKLLKGHKFLHPFLRKTVAEMLVKAASNLPVGHTFLVVTCYRSFDMQKEMYWNRKKQLAKKHPFRMIFQYPKWIKMVNTYTSSPGGSSHHTASAIDLTVVDQNGIRLDMGASLTDFGKKVHMENDLITDEHRKNRKVLRDAMTSAGFAYYPLEWWHYCYGDRMWATYNSKKDCFYGPVVLDTSE